MTALSGWENFYVIVGSSAGALIGLQFVVITLIADTPIGEGAAQAGHAFATPTIVHFGAVLLLAGVLSAPWHGIAPAAVLWGLMGLSGVVYAAIVARRLRRQTAYKPGFEDWLFHCFPAVCGIYNAVGVCISSSFPQRRGAIWRFSGGTAAPLHWHSQCLGCRHLPRLRSETKSPEAERQR